KNVEDFPYIIGGEIRSSPIIDDIDNDGRIEMLFLNPKSELHSIVAVNKCEKKSRLVWQMAGKDSQKSGRFFPNAARIYNVDFESDNIHSNQELKIKYSYFHLDGRPEQNTKIYWYKNGKHIEELDGKRVIEPKYFKKHDKLYAEIQDEENFKEYGRGPGSKIIKSREIEIKNVIPDSPQIEITPKDVFTGNRVDVKIIKESTDYDNDKIIYKYWFFKNNKKLEYPENQNFIKSEDIFKNDKISIIVTPFDGEETGKPATLDFTVKNTAPTTCEFEILPQNPTVTNQLEVRINRPSTDIDKDNLEYVYNLWLDGIFIPYDFRTNKFEPGFFKKNQEVKIGVRAYDGELYSQEVYKTVKIFNSPPLAPEVSILPLNPTVEQELKAVIKNPSIDYDGDSIKYKFIWSKNGSPIQDATESILNPNYFKKGDIVRVEVIPNDGVVDGKGTTAEIKIINAPPSIPIVHLEKTVLYSIDEAKIIFDRESRDADGDKIAYKIEWYMNGKRIQALDDRFDSKGYSLKKNEKWNIKIFATDGNDKSGINELSFEVKNSAPSRPEIAFEVAPVDRNSSLRVKIAKHSSDVDGDRVEYRVRWFVNGKEIDKNRDKMELAPENFLKNQNVVVRVIPYDGEVEGEFAEIGTFIKNAPPLSPEVTIEPKNPSVLSDVVCKVKKAITDIDNDKISVKYNWYKNSTLFLSGEDNLLPKGVFRKGDKIYCEIVGTDGEFLVSAKSDEVVVINSRPERPQVKILPEKPHTKEELLCIISNNSKDADQDKITYHFNWKMNDKPFKEGVTKLAPEDVKRGNKYTCSVIASDGELKSEPQEYSVNIQNKKPMAPSVRLEPQYPYEGDELNCKIIKPSEDIEKDEVKYKFFWYKNGQMLNFATTSASIPGRLVKRGDIYNCEVVPYDFDGDGDRGYSNSVIVLEKK
ncbi:MAG: hypothetical protein ACP5QK_01605, partial [Myxococcota bacterium]